jgi:hypothetical protein
VNGWPGGIFLASAISETPGFVGSRVYRSTSPGVPGSVVADRLVDPVFTDSSPPPESLIYYTFRGQSPDGFETSNTGLSVAPNAVLQNRIVNAEFESPNGFPGGVAYGWSGYPDNRGFGGDGYFPHSGIWCQKLSDWYPTVRALYQRVAVTPGADVIGGIFVKHTLPYLGNLVEVGIDPTGGTDPNAPSVIYQTNENRRTWTFTALRTVSQADHVTLFVRTSNNGAGTDEWFFDDAILIETSDPSLPAPTGLEVSAGGGPGCLSLSWGNPAHPEFAVARLYRSESPDELGVLVADGITAGSFQDCGLSLGKQVYYTVRAFYYSGRESANLDQVAATAPGLGDAARLEMY